MKAELHGCFFKYFLCFWLVYCFNLYAQLQKDIVHGNLILINDNGAWCWYQDERVVVDAEREMIILGGDESGSGTGGSARNGIIFSSILDLQNRTSERFELMKTSCDDHNAPAFWIRPDGKYLAMYAEHYDYYNSRYRVFDGTSWATEKRFDWTKIPGGTDYTIAYSNLYYMADEGRLYNFARANHRSPNFIISTDFGDTWSFGGQLTTNTSNSYNKGYYKYWGNGKDRIDFIFTEQHPRDTSTSIYHGYIKGGKAYASDGTIADDNIFSDSFIPAFWNFTKVFADNTIINGDAMRRCWNTDIARYNDGTIAAIITARANNNTGGNDNSVNPDLRFIYCRFDGTEWHYTYLGKAGYKMYSSEQDYTGLAAVHPGNANTIYISTSFDPRTNEDLAIREIFKGITTDNGKTWNWTPVTENSTRDNFRPVVPDWDDDNTALFWFRGTYTSAQIFNTAVVGIIETKSESPGAKSYVDASISNTKMADGSDLVYTGPAEGMGAPDNKWHIRTGYGNNSTVIASAESSGEDAPLIKTQISFSDTGTYDIWVNFWANTNADWRVKAGISDNKMLVYRNFACRQVNSNEYYNNPPVVLADGGLALYEAYAGRVQAGSESITEIFIDDQARSGSSNSLAGNTVRTWYDGISYRNVFGGVVPVELTAFTAKLSGNSVILTWETRSETNNSGFEVQRKEGSTWVALGFVKGNGTTAETSFYSFTDGNPVNSVCTYRLKQIDFDGTYKYSAAAEISLTKNYSLSQNYPNPFNPSTVIRFTIPEDEFVELKVFNVLGQEIDLLVNKVISAGSHSVTWNAVNAPAGVYFYRLKAGNYSKTIKMMLLR
jgi:hypothetical protein